MSRRLHLFDAGLSSRHGHHFNMDLGIIREAERRGIDWVVYGHSTCDDTEVRTLLRPKPLFTLGIYDQAKISADPLVNCLATNDVYFRALDSLQIGCLQSEDILFFHTVHTPHIIGLTHWLEQLVGRVELIVVVYITYIDYVDEWNGRTNYKQNLFRESILKLCSLPLPGLRLLADSPLVQEDIASFSGQALTVQLGPIPSSYQELFAEEVDDEPGDSVVRVGYFGRTRIRKGVLLLPEVISQASSTHDNLEFVVQLDVEGLYSEALEDVAAHLRDFPNVTYHRGLLSCSEYFTHLRRCDILLLPYSHGYNRQGSGIVAEGIALGRILVVPHYGGFYEQMLLFGAAATFFDSWTPESITKALTAAVDNIRDLRKKACAAVPAFLEKRGPGPCFDKLFAVSVDKPRKQSSY